MSDDRETVRLVTNALSDICRKTGGTFIGAFCVGDMVAGVVTGVVQDPARTQPIAQAVGSTMGGYINTLEKEAATMGVEFGRTKEIFGQAVSVSFASGVESVLKSGNAAIVREGDEQPFPTSESFDRCVHPYPRAKRTKDGGK